MVTVRNAISGSYPHFRFLALNNWLDRSPPLLNGARGFCRNLSVVKPIIHPCRGVSCLITEIGKKFQDTDEITELLSQRNPKQCSLQFPA